jgi:ABC-type multidrug transport system ATPase subunit
MELVADTSLIFLDEPTTGLDATSAQEVMQYLALVARRKQVCHLVFSYLPDD